MMAPQPLAADHRLADFDSDEPSLNEWLKHRALKNQTNGSSRTFVACEGNIVIGYYCLSAGAIRHAEAPGTMKRNRPDPIPVLVMGRLAIDARHHGAGQGTALVRDAILRTLQVADLAGVTALLVHALSEKAKLFYLSRGFVPSPIQPMTLCLPLSSVIQTLNELKN
jgi:GNAT superfamily N-acetyltransferase